MSKRIITLFDKPQFELLPDPEGNRLYINVDNGVELPDGRLIPVVVNSMLFTIMREALKIPADDSVYLYLSKDDSYYALCIEWCGEAACLWTYTEKTLPYVLRH